MSTLTGHDLRQAFAAATGCLERHRDVINALNVFPVPDGDTGTNMLLTMRSALERCPAGDLPATGEVASGLADGAFWGARGNSGVILSQFLRGFAQAFKDTVVCHSADLDRALDQATAAAYRSVAQPVEGTMLTVIRALSEAVRVSLDQDTDAGVRDLWDIAFLAGKEALAATPNQLPVLREAGVVDAGGMGVVVIMGGALCYLTGRDETPVDMAVAEGYFDVGLDAGLPDRSAVDSDFLDSSQETLWGYCTQFLIAGEGLSPESLRQHLAGISGSAVVVGGDRQVRVHVHTPDPGPVLSYGTSLGQLFQIDIQNMSRQNRHFVAGHRRPEAGPAIAVVAVAPGDGLASLFREAGCHAVVSGGQSMNPSVGELLEAVEDGSGEDTIILPNNKNVLLAAGQAASGNPRVHVVPSNTVPQGVAALLAFNPEESLETNLGSMTGALAGVVTIEVTRAVRPSRLGGVEVAEGQSIGLLDGDIAASGDTPEGVLTTVLSMAGLSGDKVVTLYVGADADQAAAELVRRQLEEQNPGMQVDLVYGGQPHYHYLASVE